MFQLKAAVFACEKLKGKMKDVRDKMKEPSWLELVKKCHMAGVDLSAHHMGQSFVDNLQSYVVWAAVVTEVMVDVLTGQMMITR